MYWHAKIEMYNINDSDTYYRITQNAINELKY